VTAIIAAFVGIASALLTNLLVPNLQHYFWMRQRQADRQLAVIDEVTKLGSEFVFLFHKAQGAGVDIGDREEHLHTALSIAFASTDALFSSVGVTEFRQFLSTIAAVHISLERQDPTQFTQIQRFIMDAHANLLKALYKEVGIPASSPMDYLHGVFVPPLQRGWISTREGITRLLARRKQVI
jgi:hypothetical protein